MYSTLLYDKTESTDTHLTGYVIPLYNRYVVQWNKLKPRVSKVKLLKWRAFSVKISLYQSDHVPQTYSQQTQIMSVSSCIINSQRWVLTQPYQTLFSCFLIPSPFSFNGSSLLLFLALSIAQLGKVHQNILLLKGIWQQDLLLHNIREDTIHL